jgi:hypothetical protein
MIENNTESKRITYGDIADPKFQAAFSKLEQAQTKDVTAVIELYRLGVALRKSFEEYDQIRNHLLKSYAVLNDAGELVPDENGRARFADDEASNGFAKALTELLSQPALSSYSFPLLKPETLSSLSLELSSAELSHLAPILDLS